MQQSRHQELPSHGAAGDAAPPFGQVVLRRKWLLLFGLVVGLGLGYLYFTQQAPVYRAGAQLLVQRNRPAMPTEGGQREFSGADTVATQCLVVTSPIVITNAVDKFDLGKRPEFQGREIAIARIAGGLSAVPARKQTEVMDVSYFGSTPDECRAVLTAVLDAYEAFLGKSEADVSGEMKVVFEDAQKTLNEGLQQLEAEYAKFRSEAPLFWQGEEGVNPHATRVAEIEGQRTQLVLERSRLQAQLDAIQEALRQGGSREALSLMVDQLKSEGRDKSEAVTATETLFPLLLEKELLTENLGPDHPKVQTIQKQIEMTRSHLSDLFGQKGPNRPRDLLEVYIEALQHEIDANTYEEAELTKRFESEKELAQGLQAFLTKDVQLRQELERKQQYFNVIVKRLEEMSLFDDTRGIRMQRIAEPGLGARTSVQRTKHMAVGGVLGLLFAVGIAYLLEANDRSFRGPEDIRDQIGAPVVGHVPVIAVKGKTAPDAVSAAICTVHTPRAQTAEAFRLVRTALFFGARNGKLKIIQVTSPDQGDGKSTVSANLAVAVAQSGRKTLLIDADMRRPTVHQLFKLKNDVGLSHVIGGGADPLEAICESAVPNLSILPCGPRPHNPAELLSTPAFQQLLDWARDRYDFVIVDTPPLLAVSDPGNVASRVDGVLLTIRLGKRARAKGNEAREILDRVDANLLGVVINGVNARGDYGYHAQYRYTYGGSTGYQTGYSYGAADEVETAVDPRPIHATNGHGSSRITSG